MPSNTSPPRSRPALPKRIAPYPHIKDLIARTNHLQSKDRATIKAWIEESKTHLHQAKWSYDVGKLDNAYVEYLLAFTILVVVIPECREYATFHTEKTPLYHELMALREELSSREEDFKWVRERIQEDNANSQVSATSDQLAAATTYPNEAPSQPPQNGAKKAPETRAKPGHLSSKPLVANSGAGRMNMDVGADLHARFSRLRGDSGVSVKDLPASLIPGISRPQGPRPMPTQALQIDVKNELPQMPPPVYSPSSSYGSPRGLSPPRSTWAVQSDIVKPKLPPDTEIQVTAEALYKYLKAGSGVSVLLLDVRPNEEYVQGHIFTRSIVSIDPIILRQGTSADDLETSLVLASTTEEELFKARAQFDLVVYYDQGTNDFTHLQSSMAHPLRTLHAALHDFNYTKPLRRPPLLLAGGLNAWVNIFGTMSLKSEESQGLTVSAIQRRSQQAVRAPTPLLLERRSQHPPPYPTTKNSAASRTVAMPTESGPINIEEEKLWMEQLRKERDYGFVSTVDSDAKRRSTSGTSVTSFPSKSTTCSESTVHPRTVEEYFKQYPVNLYGKQSMTSNVSGSPSTANTRRGANTIIDHPFNMFTDVRNSEFNPPASPVRPLPVVTRKSYSGVSDPLDTAGSHPIPIRPAKIALARSVSGAVSNGTTGLKNLGNSCYMNSILQCMSGTIPLSRYFLGGTYKQHINKNNPLGSRGVLAEAFAGLIRHLWSGEYPFIAPVTLKEVAGRLNETFSTSSQQDAQEFLEFLLDGLHEDLNPNASKPKLNPLTEAEERQRESLPMQVASQSEWQRYTHQNYSVTVNWLQGQLSSRLTCLTCGITSTTYSPFMYLSLPIPVDQRGTFTLHDCLREFTKAEILSGDDAWHCPNCKTRRKATKKLTIMRLPHILIIHLKRFAHQGRWRDKLNTPIGFPLTDLNLTEYVPPPLTPEETGRTRVRMEPSPETTPPFHYHLYGIVNHYGTLQGGHYTAVVKDSYREVWNAFDDSKATPIDESKVLSQNAYVLFWVRGKVL